MVTAARGLHLRDDAGRIVGAELGISDTARPSAHGVDGGFKGNGFEARGVIRSDGGSDNIEECAAWWTYPQRALRADHVRADIQGVAPLTTEEGAC